MNAQQHCFALISFPKFSSAYESYRAGFGPTARAWRISVSPRGKQIHPCGGANVFCAGDVTDIKTQRREMQMML